MCLYDCREQLGESVSAECHCVMIVIDLSCDWLLSDGDTAVRVSHRPVSQFVE